MSEADLPGPSELELMRRPVHTFWRDLWARTALLGALLVGAWFIAWEVFERGAALSGDAVHTLHLARGMGAAFLLATWSFLRIRQAHVEGDMRIKDHMTKLEQRVGERTRELEDARAFTELLFDSLRERILVLDGEGRIVKANRVAEEVAGMPLIGKTYGDVFPRAAEGGRSTSARVQTRADAHGRLWEIETTTVADRGLVIEVGRDVTEPRNLEAQLRHQEKMASLGVLTAGFAHDMGNPLASLSTELELLDGEEDVGRIRESLGVLRAHVSRMSRTLREMVDFARRRRDEIADVSVSAAIADSARLVGYDARWKKVELVVDVPADLPPVRMVEDHLVLVFINLMVNAADAMPGGGELSVRAQRDGGFLDIRVRDTGTGMAADVLANAKTPLYSTKGKRGTGLGLPVSDSVIRSIGGSLDLTSRPGAGTEVHIRLPLESEQAHA